MFNSITLDQRQAIARKMADFLYKEIRFLLFSNEDEFDSEWAFHLCEAIDAIKYQLESEYSMNLYLQDEFYEFQNVLAQYYNYPEGYLDILKEEGIIKEVIVGYFLSYVRF